MSDGTIRPSEPAAASAPTPSVLPAVPAPVVPTAASVPSPTPGSMIRYPRHVGRLTKIEIDNYRAFRGHFELDLPNGCNLLVHGENGSGKSSLYHTLRVFLEAPRWIFKDSDTGQERRVTVTDHQHRFTKNPPSIRLAFGDQVFEWSGAKNDTTNDLVRYLDQGKGFLDYKALLGVHYVDPFDSGATIDLFPLLIGRLLPYYTYPHRGTNRHFQERWEELRGKVKRRWGRHHREQDFKEELAAFNDAWEKAVHDLGSRANRMLETFGDEFKMEFRFQKAEFKTGPKRIVEPRVTALPAFRKLPVPDFHVFFNEARLSALAICLFFAALKESPASGPRLLVLDDILIGLDMANRMMVLGILERLFQDWQVIILTYHRAWFEILKSRLGQGGWQRQWKHVTLRTSRALSVECPILVTESGPLLAQAKVHFEGGDSKAAAVYARSAWEAMLGWYCAEWHLPVPYAESRRELDTDAFLCSITRHLEMLRNPEDYQFARGVVQEIKHARKFVLNPNAHHNSELEDEISAEIADGIRAVEDFELLLKCVQKTDFNDPIKKPECACVVEMLCGALEHAAANRRSAALDALACAFERHLREWFHWRKTNIPFEIELTRGFLFHGQEIISPLPASCGPG